MNLTGRARPVADPAGRLVARSGLPTGASPRWEPPVTPLLDVRGVDKSFGPVQVLHEAALSVHPGEVTALVGDNGAGKSTLIKCLGGILPMDAGDVLFEGRPVRVSGPRDAAELGIEIVHQDFALCDNLSVAENMFLGRERRRGLVLDEADMERRAAQALAALSIRTVGSVRRPVGSLAGGQRQSVAIARAMLWGSRVVVLDEPTASLGLAHAQQVLEAARKLADRGLAVVLISHNMNDVFSVADRITALFLGRTVAQVRASEVTHTQVVELITSGRVTPTL
ncbi:sugar ABC transporter ATP-binding protein [Actinomadura craniellae]|uniref:Sugar ABC transporter ATP-binding protein n=1 Tax=Actinomadura craniellae TaxID=2231787 RepID=A0A365GVS3_9ACTN|nr:sugar ABC transporter ATP-binding protein [Actinomadura craniellae]